MNLNINNDSYQYCKEVVISQHAFESCLYHSLIIENEEIMGLLIGYTNIDSTIINIVSNYSLTRNCKQKDRVEFDEIQLAKACEYADNLNKKYSNFVSTNSFVDKSTDSNNKNSNISNNIYEFKVVGWYHSHPKITVPPSVIDLNTQYYQQYQGAFVGLIFSTLNFSNKYKNLDIDIIAFQTNKCNSLNTYVPVYIPIKYDNFKIHNNNSNIIEFSSCKNYSDIINSLLEEEKNDYNKLINNCFSKTSNTDLKNIQNNSSIIININSKRQYILNEIDDKVVNPIINNIDNELEDVEEELNYYLNINNYLERKLEAYKNCKNEDDIDSLKSTYYNKNLNKE